MRGGTKLAAALAGAVALVGAAPASAATDLFPDVPRTHWAASAIAFVTDPARDWIPARPEGFGPGEVFTRRDLARAMVRAFPPDEGWTNTAVLADVATDDPLIDAFRWAAWRRWLPSGDGAIHPDAPVTRRLLDQALVRALGYARYATPVSRLRTEDGQAVVPSWSAGFMLVAERLELHRNFSDESLDLLPGQPLTRAHAADVFQRVADVMLSDPARYEWRLDGYLDIVLPPMTTARLAAARFAFRGAGFPYVWAGEWHQPTGSSYPYGTQVQGGFDCTGFVWWVLHRPSSDSYRAPQLRGYEGWNLPWRRATDMARATETKVKFDEALPLDIAFFDFDGDRSRIDHAGLLLGNGWLIHSSGSKGGVTLERVSSGYMRDAFLFARRVIPPTE